MTGTGLTQLTSAHLRTLYRYVYRGTLPCPFHRKELLSMGLNAQAEDGGILFGLEEPAVRAIIVAVLAERERFTR